MELTNERRKRLERLSTTNISDAMDAFSIRGATFGIVPMAEKWGKVIGPAITVKLTAAGLTKSTRHLGVKAIDTAEPGDVIVIDNGGRVDTSCWGGILANGAKVKGISGVFIDGACRDLDECIEADFPVFARGSVVTTARGRIMEESTGGMIQFGSVQVRQGDIAMGDRSGVVIIPVEKLEEIIARAEKLYEKEEAMIQEIKNNIPMLEVDRKYNYENMLHNKF